MKDRLLVSKKLVGGGYGKYTSVYRLIENALDKPFFVPENLLEYKEPVLDERKQKLIVWLSGLSCTQNEFETRYGKHIHVPIPERNLESFHLSAVTMILNFAISGERSKAIKGTQNMRMSWRQSCTA